MDKYKITFETWNKIASLYQEKFMDLDMYDDSYDIFCGQIEKVNASILEIGCGPGNITKYLLSKRSDLKIKAIDIAPNMIKLAKENNPSVDFKVMDCREIDRLTGKFDGIICGFCMPYLSKQDCSKLIKDSFQLLNNNAPFYFSAIVGEYNQSGYEEGSTGDKSFVYYHQEDYFRQELAANDFELIEVIKKDFLKSNGVSQTHMIFIAKKKLVNAEQ